MTTYTVKSKQDGYVWQFKYRLNGDLKAFEILEGKLSVTQMKWLFSQGNFPATEIVMKTGWIPKLRKNFEIEVGEPDLSFDAFWNAYAHKVGKKVMAENSWKKLGRATKIKALMGIKRYNNHLRLHPGVAKAHPSTYLNQEYWENEW
jgi:hypothetical protein